MMENSSRGILEWGILEVAEWLNSLPLSQNYTATFKAFNVTGPQLLKVNPKVLDQLKVFDKSDRVVIMQRVTAMRAALMANAQSSSHRLRRPSFTHFDRGSPSQRPRSVSIEYPSRYSPMQTAVPMTQDPNYRGSPTHSPRVGLKSILHKGSSMDHPRSSLRSCKETDIVEILKEENASLRSELDQYHLETRKLKKVQQELDQIKEAQQLLEASTLRRESLEKAMRTKLEEELKQQKELNIQLQAEIKVLKSNTAQKSEKSTAKKDLQRRDSVILLLLKKQRESTEMREKLEEDLLNTKAKLKERSTSPEEGENLTLTRDNVSDAHSQDSAFAPYKPSSEAAQLYVESVEKLRNALFSLKGMSQKREHLEERLKTKMEAEIHELKSVIKGRRCSHNNGMLPDHLQLLEKDVKISNLEADLARLEQKCLEFSMEQQIVLDAATLPRDARLSHLERVIQDQIDTISEQKQQKLTYIDKLYDANKRITDLESQLQTIKNSLFEKESLIQTFQDAFLHNQEDEVFFKQLKSAPQTLHQKCRREERKTLSLPRVYSSDDIKTPPTSPGRRRRVCTDMPAQEEKSQWHYGVRTPRRVGSLVRAASTEMLMLDCKQPRSIPIKGTTEKFVKIKRSKSEDLLDMEEGTRPVRRNSSKNSLKRRSAGYDLAKLTSVERVKSHDTGLDKISQGQGIIRVLSSDKVKLTDHVLDTLVKATSIDSINTESSETSNPGSPLLSAPTKPVHRFSALSPTNRKRSPDQEEGRNTVKYNRSQSFDVVENMCPSSESAHEYLSDSEVNDRTRLDLMDTPSYTSLEEADGMKMVKGPNSTSCRPHSNSPNLNQDHKPQSPLPSLATVSQKVTSKRKSMEKTSLTAWTSARKESKHKVSPENSQTGIKKLSSSSRNKHYLV